MNRSHLKGYKGIILFFKFSSFVLIQKKIIIEKTLIENYDFKIFLFLVKIVISIFCQKHGNSVIIALYGNEEIGLCRITSTLML